MVNQLKIITMTRLALYDKHEGVADRAANDYFRHDYIYRNNLGTRLAVGLGSIIILVIYWLQAFLLNEMDLFELNFQQYATDSLMFIVAVLAVYSLIGTIQGTRQYYLIQKRLAQYQALVRQLERLEERAHIANDEEAADAEQPIHTSPPRTKPPVSTRRPAPEYAAPPMRIGGQATGPERPVAAGSAAKPGQPETTEGTARPGRPETAENIARPPRPEAAEGTARPPRHETTEGTARPPRPKPPEPSMPPRPGPPPGYARPHPSSIPPARPPRPRPEGSALPEGTRIPRPPGKPAGS